MKGSYLLVSSLNVAKAFWLILLAFSGLHIILSSKIILQSFSRSGYLDKRGGYVYLFVLLR